MKKGDLVREKEGGSYRWTGPYSVCKIISVFSSTMEVKVLTEGCGERYTHHTVSIDRMELINKGGIVSTGKELVLSAREQVRPYERYIGLAVFLVVVDHFVFNNKFQDSIQKLGSKLINKVTSTLDKFIESL